MNSQTSKGLTKSSNLREIDNFVLTGNQHPFLNSLIVENVLKFCQVNCSDNKSFSALRLVSQVWNAECTNILQREVQIPINRLVEPYPEGLGWAWNRCHRATGLKYDYKCPLPPTKEFENIQILVTCESGRDKKLIRWFRVMGEHVKSLHFTCAVKCFHEIELLGNVLHKWCPNLDALHLDGLQCFASLLYFFEGKLDDFRSFKDCKINCESLKSLIISVNGECRRTNCISKVGQLPIMVYNPKFREHTFMGDFKEIIDFLPAKVHSKSSDFFYKIIETGTLKKLSDIYKYYPEMIGVDWGILGNVLRTASLQKLVVYKLVDVSHAEQLFMFLLIHSNRVRPTFKHLEFQNTFLSSSCLRAFSLIKCSLSTLCLDHIVWSDDASTCLKNILINCSETLKVFEVGLESNIDQAIDHEHHNVLQVPYLPKLKSFTNKTICLLHVNGLDLLSAAPDLEECEIQNLRFEGHSADNRQMIGMALQTFCTNLDNPSIKGHPLKELKIKLCIESQHITLLRKGLFNLVKVEFTIQDPSKLILDSPKCSGWEKLEAIRLKIENWRGSGGFKKVTGNDFCKCFDILQNLKFFELTLPLNTNGFLPVDCFKRGFRKLRNLTSLKIFNMLITREDKDDIDKSVKHIPFVSFFNLTVISMETKRSIFKGHK